MVHRIKNTEKRDWKYGFREGDEVGIKLQAFSTYVPAKIVDVEDNMLTVETRDNQEFTVRESDVVMIEPSEREVFRISKRLR